MGVRLEQAFLAFEPLNAELTLDEQSVTFLAARWAKSVAPKRPIFMAERDFDYEMSFWESPAQVIVMFGDALLVHSGGRVDAMTEICSEATSVTRCSHDLGNS